MADNEKSKIKGYPNYADSEDHVTGSPYELYGRDLDIDDSDIDTGWNVGKSVTVEDYDNQKDRTFNEIRDPNSNIFRYGLWYDIYSNVEDPTVLGFTCEIDDSDNSPLFSKGPNGASAFIEKYSSIPEIAARKRILRHFQKNIKMVFKSMLSTKTDEDDFPYVKSHYLEKIQGLKSLSNKFIKYKENELSFTMHEDVTMYAQYLAQLYNSLAYSYRNGKNMIPENLLRFNLVIRFSEIRNFKTVVKAVFDAKEGEGARRSLINVNSSFLQYTLYDCNFVFFESQNHGDDTQVSGMGASVASSSNMDFKIHFKRTSRKFKTEIIDDLQKTTNSRMDLNDREYDPWHTLKGPNAFFKTASTQPDFSEENRNVSNDFSKNTGTSNLTPNVKESSSNKRDEERNLSSQNMASDPNLKDKIGNAVKGKVKKMKERAKQDLLNNANRYKESRKRDFKKLQDSLKNRGLGAVNDIKNGVLEDFRRKRGDLLNQLVNEIGTFAITPDNVYTDTFDPNSINNIIKDLGSTVGGDIEDLLRGFNNF